MYIIIFLKPSNVKMFKQTVTVTHINFGEFDKNYSQYRSA